jgi:hypothetical protein
VEGQHALWVGARRDTAPCQLCDKRDLVFCRKEHTPKCIDNVALPVRHVRRSELSRHRNLTRIFKRDECAFAKTSGNGGAVLLSKWCVQQLVKSWRDYEAMNRWWCMVEFLRFRDDEVVKWWWYIAEFLNWCDL